MEVRDLLEKFNLEYKFSTKDYIIKCLNPEHEDSSPSCHVDKISGIFQCWSCGFSGNIYEFFKQTVPSLVNAKVERLKQSITKLMWSKPINIPVGAVAHEWDFRGISGKTLMHFGAFTSDDNDLDLEGRIIFPLEDMDGDIRLLVARHMYSDLDPKYKYYPAHTEIPLYPEIPTIVDGSIILVEGIFDMLNLWDKGLKNVVLCGGVNMGLVKKRVKQQKNIERLLPYKYQGVHTLYIMFDGDKAGRGAAAGLQNYAKEAFNVEIIDLEDDKDPGNLTQIEVNNIKEKLYG